MAQKTNTASEVTHRFSTVEGFFATQKFSVLGTGHKVQGGGPAEIGAGSSIFKLTKRGGSSKYWSCL